MLHIFHNIPTKIHTVDKVLKIRSLNLNSKEMNLSKTSPLYFQSITAVQSVGVGE
jgi:hypothetical protein